MDNRKVTLDELSRMDKELLERKNVHTVMVSTHESVTLDMMSYRKSLDEEEWDKYRYKDIEAGVRLHRADVMGFSNDMEFQDRYEKYRLNICKSVESYRRLEEIRDNDPSAFLRTLESMRMTVTTFEKMSDKINLLEMQGRYMDARAKILINPQYLNLDREKRSRLRDMSIEDIQKELTGLEPGVEYDSKKSMLEAWITIKKMEKYGIAGKAESTRRKVTTYEKKIPGKNKNGIFSFNTGYYDIGGIKRGYTKKGFWDYIKSKKWKIGSSDSNSKYGKIGGEAMEAAGVKTNLALGKYRVVKLGGRFVNKRGNFSVGAHVSGGTAKGAADVGLSITSGMLWQNKVYASASATAYGARGVAKISGGYRKDWFKADARGEGNIGYATTAAQAGVGLIRHVDDRGQLKEGFGATARLSAKAAVFEGSVGGGITIFGVRIGGRVMGNALSIGASVKATATTGHLSFGLSASLGLGTGFEISIDWTGLKEKFANWRNRRKQRKKLRELREQEKAQKAQNKKESKPLLS